MLSPVSLQTFEINDKGFVVRVEDDKICFTKDGETTNVYFNCLYNKTEIDNLIAGDVDPHYLQNICLTTVNVVLQGLEYYNSLSYSEDDGQLNVIKKDVKHSANVIYEMFQWLRDIQTEISVAHNSLYYDVNEKDKALWDKINTIKDCHCMDEGGFHDTVMKQIEILRNDVDATDELGRVILKPRVEKMSEQIYKLGRNSFQISPTQLMSPLKEISCLYNEGTEFLTNRLTNIWTPINDENETESHDDVNENEPALPDYPVIDPSQEISKLTVPLIDDPHKRTFDEKKPVYGTLMIPYDIQVNGLINGVDITDIQPGPSPGPGDSYFKKTDGYDYFYVKNENVDIEDYVHNDVQCNKLSINGISAATINKLKTITEPMNVLRFILRKNEIFDDSGDFIKEFYCYVSNQRLICPVITLSQANSLISYTIDCVEVSWDEKPFIAFDKQITFEPYSLYLRGELSIMYLLPQDTIESVIPEIKCDIINARNALKLHESNVAYLYKPSRITENDEYYSMTFHIDQNYTIPINMTFTFNEYCFMNNWTLTWTGTEWIGNNIQGRSNGKMINKLNRMCENDYTVAVGVMKSDFNDFVINTFLGGLSHDNLELMNVFSKHHPTLNIVYDNDDDFSVERDGLPSLKSMLKLVWNMIFSEPGAYPIYDDVYACPMAIELHIPAHTDINKVKESYLKHIKEITADLNIGGVSNKFAFELTSTEPHEFAGGYGLKIKAINDTVDELNVLVQKCDIDKTKKDVTLRLDKSTLRPREEINWDPNTNPFQYIIDQQFYSITPNPNAATT